MKWGLRLQLLVLLGALLLLSYVPLFFATSTYTRLGLEQLEQRSALHLGRSYAQQLLHLREALDAPHFTSVMHRSIREKTSLEEMDGKDEKSPPPPPIVCAALLNSQGEVTESFGDDSRLRRLIREKNLSEQEVYIPLGAASGTKTFLYEPFDQGGIALIVEGGKEPPQAASLARMMALYMVVGALGMLVMAYFALTRWIVRPILELERGANRVAAGGHRLESLKGAPKELTTLSERLGQMTALLREEEDSLRAKISELERMTLELKEAQASLVRSERLATVGRLAAGLAHEVGNPISSLMGLQDLMIDGGLSQEEEQDFLRRMRQETSRIHRVLSDLLAYARPSGKSMQQSVLSEPGLLQSAVVDTLALLGPQSDLKGMHFESQIAPDLGELPLSHEELTQILLNLMMNAADACEHKGRVLVRAKALPNECIQLIVEDDGPGILDLVKESLFEPFVSTKEVGKGTGLGLAVTKGLVEGAGGFIRVESSALGGAKFEIELPLQLQQDQ